MIYKNSNVNPTTFAVVNLRLQHMKNTEARLGTLMFIFVNDSFQLPPSVSFP